MEAVDKYRLLQDEYLEHCGVKADSRFIRIGNPQLNVHLIEAGDGDPLLLINGGDGEAVNWAPLMASLQDHSRTIAVDLPGFGLSDPVDFRTMDLRKHAADFIMSILDTLGLRSVSITCASFGAFYALAAALENPERVRNLIFVGNPVGIYNGIPLLRRLVYNVPPFTRLLIRTQGNIKSQRNRYRVFYQADDHKVTELYFKTRIAGISLPAERYAWSQLLSRFAGFGRKGRQTHLEEEVTHLTIPSLMIVGEYGRSQKDSKKAWMQGLKEGYLGYLPDTGYLPFVEAPQQTARIIDSFLRFGSGVQYNPV